MVVMDSRDLTALPSDIVADDEEDNTTNKHSPSQSPSAVSGGLNVQDKHIAFASLHAPLPLYLRLDILPFIIIYVLVILLAVPAMEYELYYRPVAVSNTTLANAAPSAIATILNATSASLADDDLAAASTDFEPTPVDTKPAVPAPADYTFYFMIALPLLVIAHGLILLSAYWSLSLLVFLRYSKRPNDDVRRAPFIRLIPQEHCGQPAIAPLQHAIIDGHDTLYFTFQKTKYIYYQQDNDEEHNSNNTHNGHNMNNKMATTSSLSSGYFAPLHFPIALPLKTYLQSTGISSDKLISLNIDKYGQNIFDIPLPPFMELFMEHAMAPFFVFQMFCVLLWCLDEYWYYSVMTAFMLITFECTVVQRRLKHLQYLRDMRIPPFNVQVYRHAKWQIISSTQLLPTDLVSVTRSTGEMVVPCDVVLISGQCVVNEALLTGESVPQVKDDVSTLTSTDRLSINKDHKRHVLFGGTKILMCTPANSKTSDAVHTTSIKAPPDHGCIGYVLRTGFHSSQGKLVRTILYSTERVSVNNTESLFFILFLLIFAVAASAYVLYEGLLDETRSRYKLLLNCVMIITSVVPPELPMELSLAVNTSLMQLAKMNIFCTEPFRIPLAGAIDICCFDKTGTLTTDNFQVKGIASVDAQSGQPVADTSLVSAETISMDTKYVIAGCHSLAVIPDTGIVGDPLEKSAFNAIGWSYKQNDTAISTPPTSGEASAPSGPKQTHRIRIVQRFAFTSALKRMSAIVCLDHLDTRPCRVVVKGAAEVLHSMFAELPPNYEANHSYYERQGCRVIALGYKHLPFRDGPDDRKALREITREQAECDLLFAGFLILQCPMKQDSAETIKHLLESSHSIIMITGDHTLTACSVAAELTITTLPTLILTHRHEHNDVIWQSVDGITSKPFDMKCATKDLLFLTSEYDLCVSGDAMEYIMTHCGVSAASIGQLIAFVKVFARTSPDQKELILTRLKLSGRVTLMCGDGTNDVGALKQAHVGVALIGDDGSGDNSKKKVVDKAAEEKRKAEENMSFMDRLRGKMEEQKKLIASQQAAVAAAAANGKPMSAAEKRAVMNARLQEDMKKIRAEMEASEPPPVRLGDASIASPFTSKVPYITSTVNIIRQGRCTLVTTLQMFHILGINSLMSAYSMSVLYLDGVKMGDTQMTITGLSVAMFFLFISWTKPLDRLSAERPYTRIFTPYMMLSVMGQFALHLVTLLTAVSLAVPHTPTDIETKSPEGKFAPNVLNTVVYLVSTVSTVSTFVANYRGRPFMISLRENTALYRSLMALYALMITCATGMFPALNEMIELVPFPTADMHMQIVGLLIFDLASTVIYSYILKKVFAINPKRQRLPVLSDIAKKKTN